MLRIQKKIVRWELKAEYIATTINVNDTHSNLMPSPPHQDLVSDARSKAAALSSLQ